MAKARFSLVKLVLAGLVLLALGGAAVSLARQLDKPSQVTGRLCPDLVIEGLWAKACSNCSCQCPGKSYSLSAQVFEGAVVKIKNTGNARSGETRLEIAAEKGFFVSGPNVYLDIPAIDPGKTYVAHSAGFHVFYNVSTGLRIHAIVDYQNRVAECDETNNMKVVTTCEAYPETLI
jgi:CARDB